MILIIVCIGKKKDFVLLIKSGKKNVVVLTAKKKYASIVIIGHYIVFVIMNVVQYVMNIYEILKGM